MTGVVACAQALVEPTDPESTRFASEGHPGLSNAMTNPEVAHRATAMMFGRLDADHEIAIPHCENMLLRQ
jgi:hypothetical protein